MTQRVHQKRRKADPARRLAYSALLAVETHGAYANLALADHMRHLPLNWWMELPVGRALGIALLRPPPAGLPPNSSRESGWCCAWRHIRSWL